MSVFKKYNGKRITSKHPKYADARWWMYKRIKGHKTIHKSLPEAQNKEQAETAERKEIEKIFNRKYGIYEVVGFTDFVDKTYLKYVRQNNADQTGKKIFTDFLKSFFQNKPLLDITAQDCRDCQFKLKHSKTKHGKPYANDSINKYMSTLGKIFTLACQEGKLENSPMRYVEKLKPAPARKRVLTAEQKEKLFTELDKDLFLKRIVILALNLPLRKAQILRLVKEGADFERRLLTVPPSKGKPARIVPMNETAFEVLKVLCDSTESGYLVRLDGEPVKDFGKRWRNCLKRAGINSEDGNRETNFHFHDLRANLGSRLIANNVNPYDVQELFAHSDMKTSAIYIESDMDRLFSAVRTLDDNGAVN
jgi:integrase